MFDACVFLFTLVGLLDCIVSCVLFAFMNV